MIRRADESDFSEINKILNLSEESIKNNLVYVYDKGQVLGFIEAFKTLDEGEIYNIAVLNSHRRLGIGESLITFLIQEFKKENIKKIFLEVRNSNIPAISLYEKMGFERVSTRKNYYQNPIEDAIIMFCCPNKPKALF